MTIEEIFQNLKKVCVKTGVPQEDTEEIFKNLNTHIYTDCKEFLECVVCKKRLYYEWIIEDNIKPTKPCITCDEAIIESIIK